MLTPASEGARPRIAVIGTGYWGVNLVRNFHELDALAVICDSDPSRLQEIAKNYPGCATCNSIAKVLGDPAISAVAIATPAATHAALVREALMAGKDVFVEKPLALALNDAHDLVKKANQCGRILMVGHLLWYHPAILKLKELVDAGTLGRIQYIYSNRLNLGKIRREENILWSFAPHDISVILGLLGEMPTAVTAHGGNYLHPQIADVTLSQLSFPSGVKGHIFVSWLHPFKEQKLILVGDRQMAVFDDVEKSKKLVLYPHTVVWKGQMPVANRAEGQPVPVDFSEPLRNECLHFLECVQTRRQPRTDGAEGLRVLTVLQQCQQALETEPERFEPDPSLIAEPLFKAHESAFIDEGCQIGAGTTIWHVSHILRGSRIGKNCRIGQNVVVGPDAEVGDGVKIQNNVSVYEGVTLEDHVFCGPSMVFTNVVNPRSEVSRMKELRRTLVRTGATLGANCTIVCGVTIGRYAFVGAGAVVTRDVPDHALVIGSPARMHGWMCECGLKLKMSSENTAACTCGKAYQKRNEGVCRIDVMARGEATL